MPQAPVVAAERRQEEIGGLGGDAHPLAAPEHSAGFGKGAHRQRVPVGEHLVIGRGGHAVLPRFKESAANLRHARFQVFGCKPQLGGNLARVAGHPQHIAPFPVAAFTHGVEGDGNAGVFFTQQAAHFVHRPDVEFAFFPFTVGVLAAVKAPRRVAHVAHEIGQGFFNDALIAWRMEGLPGVQIDRGELRVIVEHFLKVGYKPIAVYRVAVETAPQLVVDAAERHAVERGDEHTHGVFTACASPGAQKQFQVGGLWEFGGAPETAPFGVVVARHFAHRGCQQVGREGARSGSNARVVVDEGDKFIALCDQIFALVLPRMGDALQHLHERRHAVAWFGGEVGAGVERFAVGREENRHRPAP